MSELRFINPIIAGTFSFHQLEVVKNLSEVIVPSNGLMKNILSRDAEWKAAWIVNFQVIRVKIDENVSSGRVGTMDQCVRQKLANDHFFVMRDGLAEDAVRKFRELAPFWDFTPHSFDEF